MTQTSSFHPPLISYADWMKETSHNTSIPSPQWQRSGPGRWVKEKIPHNTSKFNSYRNKFKAALRNKPRSSELRAFDNALKGYEEGNVTYEDVKDAFINFVSKKKKDLNNYDTCRNKKGMVSEMAFLIIGPSRCDLNVGLMFSGCEIKLKESKKINLTTAVNKTVEVITKQLGVDETITGEAQKIVGSLKGRMGDITSRVTNQLLSMNESLDADDNGSKNLLSDLVNKGKEKTGAAIQQGADAANQAIDKAGDRVIEKVEGKEKKFIDKLCKRVSTFITKLIKWLAKKFNISGNVKEIMQFIIRGGKHIPTLIAHLAPGAALGGFTKNLKNCFSEAVNYDAKKNEINELKSSSNSLNGGTIIRANEVIIKILEREKAEGILGGLFNAISAALKVFFAITTGGLATMITAIIEDAMIIIKDIVKAVQLYAQMIIVRARFSGGSGCFDMGLFGVCPLAACYATDFTENSLWKNNPMLSSNTNKVDIMEPLLKAAKKLIDAHPCEITGMGGGKLELLEEVRSYPEKKARENAIRSFYNDLKMMESDLLSQTYLTEVNFTSRSKTFNLGKTPITINKWKSLTNAGIGRQRGLVTTAIDNKLDHYKLDRYLTEDAFKKGQKINAICAEHPEHLFTLTCALAKRKFYVEQIAKDVNRWINEPKTKKMHDKSPRNPGMLQLQYLLELERKALSDLSNKFTEFCRRAKELDIIE